ncbi:MAG: TIGR01777 family protein [Gammaproteobacteria bacterium RIFCSPHIGHO2_12_FULL_45_9]|nr:MAG: TIGR01777 family protein [Gammaproteobacteria bacterium RIFCSPHIGHO2_12_FULL_45_9]
MERILAGGTGFIGQYLVREWLAQGKQVAVIGRSKEKIQKLFQGQVRALEWSELTADTFRQAEVVINLAGAGIGEQRWTEKRKTELVDSRTKTTTMLATLLAQLGKEAPRWFNASAASIYGLQSAFSGLPSRFDGAVGIDKDIVAPDFLSYIAREWEQAAKPAINKGVHVVFLRFGVVLAKDGGALPHMVRPFYYFLGGPIGTGNQPFCWVTLPDVAAVIDFLLAHPEMSGPVDVVAPGCVPQREFAEIVGEVLHRPTAVPMPGFLLKLLFGEMAQELLLQGQYVYPKRLIDMGFKFFYPELKPALQLILKPSQKA